MTLHPGLTDYGAVYTPVALYRDAEHIAVTSTKISMQPPTKIGPWGAKWEPRGGSERLRVHPLGPKAHAQGSSRRKRKMTGGIFGTLGRPQAPLVRRVQKTKHLAQGSKMSIPGKWSPKMKMGQHEAMHFKKVIENVGDFAKAIFWQVGIDTPALQF